ncbi:hypothetical protein FGO68_gene17038 [Halteria grandinella]|uniref:Uncharacterized protein n=1 Tax=Halteria grandinella TaxID=5974 RepID=A0A8J8NDK4_HALGN|nr:hypothetical protein FGO68_gene17038 [Halteria grandinella]
MNSTNHYMSSLSGELEINSSVSDSTYYVVLGSDQLQPSLEDIGKCVRSRRKSTYQPVSSLGDEDADVYEEPDSSDSINIRGKSLEQLQAEKQAHNPYHQDNEYLDGIRYLFEVAMIVIDQFYKDPEKDEQSNEIEMVNMADDLDAGLSTAETGQSPIQSPFSSGEQGESFDLEQLEESLMQTMIQQQLAQKRELFKRAPEALRQLCTRTSLAFISGNRQRSFVNLRKKISRYFKMRIQLRWKQERASLHFLDFVREQKLLQMRYLRALKQDKRALELRLQMLRISFKHVIRPNQKQLRSE